MQRVKFLSQVKLIPFSYVVIDEEYKSDPEICLATLSAINFTMCFELEFCTNVLEPLFQHLPNFEDHKRPFFPFLRQDDDFAIRVYLRHFGPAIYGNREFLQKAVAASSRSELFEGLPLHLRSDPGLIALTIESVAEPSINGVIAAVPSEVLEDQQTLLIQAIKKAGFLFCYRLVPNSFWSRREFVMMWTEEPRFDFSVDIIPTEFKADCEICLSLFRSQVGLPEWNNIVLWMQPSFLKTDKDFILECMSLEPNILEHCGQRFQRDFDVLLEAAFQQILFGTLHEGFIDKLREYFATFSNLVRTRIRAHDEFMTLLMSLWKSRIQEKLLPWHIIECDPDTARGLKQKIASFLGFPSKDSLQRLLLVWEEFVAI